MELGGLVFRNGVLLDILRRNPMLRVYGGVAAICGSLSRIDFAIFALIGLLLSGSDRLGMLGAVCIGFHWVDLAVSFLMFIRLTWR